MGADTYQLKDHIIKTTALKNGYTRYDVVYKVEDHAQRKHQEGKKVKYKLSTEDNDLSDFVETTIKKDLQKNTPYAEITLFEYTFLGRNISFVTDTGQQIIAKNTIKDFPFLFNGKTQTFDIKLNDKKDGNEIVAQVNPDLNGELKAETTPDPSCVGKRLTIDNQPYGVVKAEKKDNTIQIQLKK